MKQSVQPEKNPVPVHILLVRLWHNLGRRRQREFGALMGLTLLGTFSEVISLGAVLPFLSILIEPERAMKYPFVENVATLLKVENGERMVLTFTVIFIAIALVAGSLRLLLLWANTRFAFASGADLSIEVYRKTLYQPYVVHLSKNSSEVVNEIINKVNGVVFWVMLPVLTLISSSVLIIAITITLLLIDKYVALASFAGFGASYWIITWVTRRRLRLNSQRIARDQGAVIKALQEGLGGIRDVLLDNTQEFYCDLYRKADRPLRKAYGNNIFIGGSPRFAMEAIGMALIASLAYAMSQREQGISSALPVIGAITLGAQRLLPALQQSYSAWASIIGSYDALSDTVELLDQALPVAMLKSESQTFSFKKEIEFKAVKFRYNNDGPWVLNGFDLKVLKGIRLGIIGSTGCGKSTALDILMGLLRPVEGRLLIDGEPCDEVRIQAWQNTIAHVPQTIFLSDSSLAENIAFGIPKDCIDMYRVRQAAQKAQIARFIESRPEGYDARVGERGIRLSGGQRQRIGIARALYKQASVLVFDEATSALDNDTEMSVMEGINTLSRSLTVLIIAHRITTLKDCDEIVVLESGRITRKGNYSELFGDSEGHERSIRLDGWKELKG